MFRTSVFNEIIKNELGDDLHGDISSYQSLQGESGVLWFRKKNSKEYRRVTRYNKDLVKNRINSLSKTECSSYSFIEWVYVRAYGGYDNIVVEAYQRTRFFLFCYESTNGDNETTKSWIEGWPPSDAGGESDRDLGDSDISNCDENIRNGINSLVGNSVVTNETISVSQISAVNDERVVKYNWMILKNLGWYLFSWEQGVHVKTRSENPRTFWKWKSLSHKGVGRVGIVVGGNVEYSVKSATPTVGTYNALMDIDFLVTYSVICKNSPFSTGLAYNSKKVFNSND